VTRTLHHTVHIVDLCKKEDCVFIFHSTEVNAICGKLMLSKFHILLTMHHVMILGK